jgi:hypothetical protein
MSHRRGPIHQYVINESSKARLDAHSFIAIQGVSRYIYLGPHRLDRRSAMGGRLQVTESKSPYKTAGYARTTTGVGKEHCRPSTAL